MKKLILVLCMIGVLVAPTISAEEKEKPLDAESAERLRSSEADKFSLYQKSNEIDSEQVERMEKDRKIDRATSGAIEAVIENIIQ